VPYDVAFSLDDIERSAYEIILGKMEGNQWDFSAWRWKERT
jgi:hypothetical protein